MDKNEISLALGNALILLDMVQTSGRQNLDRMLTAMQQIEKVRNSIIPKEKTDES